MFCICLYMYVHRHICLCIFYELVSLQISHTYPSYPLSSNSLVTRIPLFTSKISSALDFPHEDACYLLLYFSLKFLTTVPIFIHSVAIPLNKCIVSYFLYLLMYCWTFRLIRKFSEKCYNKHEVKLSLQYTNFTFLEYIVSSKMARSYGILVLDFEEPPYCFYNDAYW